jgi:hypothetical protein
VPQCTFKKVHFKPTACRDCKHLIVTEPKQTYNLTDLFWGASPNEPEFDCYTGQPREAPADASPSQRFQWCAMINHGDCKLFKPLSECALVLGWWRASGNAWAIGVITGLFDAGLDVTQADLIIGTSAGSTVGAQRTSATRPTELLAAILATVPQPRTGPAGSYAGRVPNGPAAIWRGQPRPSPPH